MYAQIIDDVAQNTLVSASTLDKDVKSSLEKTNNIEAAKKLYADAPADKRKAWEHHFLTPFEEKLKKKEAKQ